MVTLYKRVEKNKNNLYGIEMLKMEDFPLLQPTMLCLSAQTSYPKSVFGIIREGMRAARLRTSQNVAGRYALKDFPINFVGATYDNRGNNFGTTLAEDYFLPLITKNCVKLDVRQAKKNMRNITIMTYCDGILTYLDLEARLVNLMRGLGYSEENIKAIIGELSLVSVLSMHDTSKCLATSFQLIDVNDNEIFDEATPSLIASLKKQKTKHDFIPTSDNSGIYYFNGTGEHSIKSFFADNYLPHAIIAAIVSQSLTRSIDRNQEFSFDYMQEMIASIINHHKVGYTPNEIMADLDDQINYVGAHRLTEEECEYLDTIDALSRKANNFEHDNRLLKSANETQRQNYDKLEEAIRSTVSKIDYIQVMQKIGYQFSQEDLKLLEEYNKAKQKALES